MARIRLTITLKDTILRLLDGMVDGQRIRNRSHAIEYLLSQTLLPKQTKVLILAGGEGVNFRPLTFEMPKSLIPVAGKPLLEHTILNLRRHNLTDVTISLGYLGEKIKAYFGDGSRWGLQISYLEQSQKKTGTAQPLKQAQERFGSGNFLLLYGDVLTDINFVELLEFHRSQKGTLATMALAPVERVSMWGVTKVIGNKIVEFEEKPNAPKTHSHLVNAGIYVMEPGIFKYIDRDCVRLERDVFPRLADEGKLAAYPFEGKWYDVSTPEIYERVIKDWRASG
ncbi:MAG: nucleotidyltransferase family protein [Patescibacteria group bacterium]|nr:nucleotidyltransferase family protein [Patescibacteria group bacterium]